MNFNSTNRIRIFDAFTGASLDHTKTQPSNWGEPNIAETILYPPWLYNTDQFGTNFIEPVLTFVNGTNYNLNLFTINGTKEYPDIMSMHEGTVRTDRETLVYFAKYYLSELATVNFTSIYSIPADTSRIR